MTRRRVRSRDWTFSRDGAASGTAATLEITARVLRKAVKRLKVEENILEPKKTVELGCSLKKP